jgi:hypothetical protein
MFFIRDFLMSCLLVFGGGHRGDVIRNMTLEEWGDRRKETSGPQKNEVRPVSQSWHPTHLGTLKRWSFVFKMTSFLNFAFSVVFLSFFVYLSSFSLFPKDLCL